MNSERENLRRPGVWDELGLPTITKSLMYPVRLSVQSLTCVECKTSSTHSSGIGISLLQTQITFEKIAFGRLRSFLPSDMDGSYTFLQSILISMINIFHTSKSLRTSLPRPKSTFSPTSMRNNGPFAHRP